jgi:hypothetical protein
LINVHGSRKWSDVTRTRYRYWAHNLRRPNAIPIGVGGTDWPIRILRLASQYQSVPSPPPLTCHWHGIRGWKLSPHRYLLSRLSLQVFYQWRHVLSTATPFILWWSNLEILFAPHHRSSSFIGGLRC